MYTDATGKILGFDKYKDISAKDNERMWRARKVVIDYDLSIASHLLIDRCNYENLMENTSVKADDGRFRLDEADMAIVLVWSEYDLHT